MKIILLVSLFFSINVFANKNVLVIGDSHTAQSFGVNLHGNLESIEGYTVSTLGNCGSSPRGWLTRASWATTNCGYFHGFVDGGGWRGTKMKTPYLPDLLENMDYRNQTLPTPIQDPKIYKPDFVVIALGANQVNRLETTAQYNSEKKTVIDMVDYLKRTKVKCLWVGPPDGNPEIKPEFKQDRLYRMLKDAINESGNYCGFLGSREKDVSFMKYPVDCYREGIHWDSCTEGKIKAVRWANYVTDKIKTMVK